jgi:hypothetical protein
MLMLHKQAAFEGCSEEQLRCLGDAFGLGPYAKPYVPNYRECPKCHEKKARVKEVHADTGMDDFELKCDACGAWSDIEPEKSAFLGAGKLMGNGKVVKDFIRHMRGMDIPINRVRPANPAAILANTSHLPVGASQHSFSKVYPGLRRTTDLPMNTSSLDVGKGVPRVNLQMRDGKFFQTPGVQGGTNPSPIASMFHEGGHAMHQRELLRVAKQSPERFGGVPHWKTLEYGNHFIPGQPGLSTVLDEIGANNAALQFGQQAGATPEAMNFYRAARQNSFNTYKGAVENTPLAQQVMQRGGKGYTDDLRTVNLYEGFGKSASAELVLRKKASIAPKDLRYWDDVNDAVAKKISALTPEEQAQAAAGQVSVIGSCGHPIRQGNNGVTVEIGKECFTCMQANAPLLKSGSILELFGGVELEKYAVVKQDADTGKWILWARDGKRKLGTHDTPDEAYKQEYAIQKAQERKKSASAEETAQDLMKRPCCGSGCDNCPYYPRYQKGNTEVRAEFKKSASSRSAEIQQLLNDSDIPADVYFYTDGKGRATVCLGDWHEDPVPDIAIQFGRANWDQWEDPDDTEIGKPSWATATLSKRQEKAAAIAAHIRRARNVTHTDPTPAQAHEGNYRKGEFTMHGMTIKLENPKGTTRRGYKDGKEIWARVMQADYGYFKGTEAVDGDAIDCFVGPNPDSEMVVAIDQYRGDTFDETKFVLGVDSQDEGSKLYLAHYPKGWRLGPVSTTTVQQLKAWLKAGKHKVPFKGQLVKAASISGLLRSALSARSLKPFATNAPMSRRVFFDKSIRKAAPMMLPDTPMVQAGFKGLAAATNKDVVSKVGDTIGAVGKIGQPHTPQALPKMVAAGGANPSRNFTDAAERMIPAVPKAPAELPGVAAMAMLPGTYSRRSLLQRFLLASATDANTLPTLARFGAGVTSGAGNVANMLA